MNLRKRDRYGSWWLRRRGTCTANAANRGEQQWRSRTIRRGNAGRSVSTIELLGCVIPTSTQRTKWAQANHSLASTLAPAGSKNRSACTRARRRWYRAMCASARGSASSTGASMTGRCRTVRAEELSFEVIGRRVVGSEWLSDGWYCIVFGERHLYINKPSAKRRAGSQYR